MWLSWVIDGQLVRDAVFQYLKNDFTLIHEFAEAVEKAPIGMSYLPGYQSRRHNTDSDFRKPIPPNPFQGADESGAGYLGGG